MCDVMLVRLARLLRAAGHDAALAPPDAADRQILAQALEQGRLLLTRDRRLAIDAGPQAFFVHPDRPEEQARLLAATFDVDWLAAPFTRCLIDNTQLRPAEPNEMLTFPSDLPRPVNACPGCRGLYWPGSHVRRMLRRLEVLAGR